MSSAPRTLASVVFLSDEDGKVTEYRPGDSPPAAVAKRITNPAAWVSDEHDDSSRPAQTALKEDWVNYAITQGMTPEQANSLNKEQLITAFSAS